MLYQGPLFLTIKYMIRMLTAYAVLTSYQAYASEEAREQEHKAYVPKNHDEELGTLSELSRERHCSIEDLPDELHLIIFSSLNQKNIPSVTSTSQRWKRLMSNNQLWKGYAKRALLLLKEDSSQERNYKALVREHSTLSFTELGFLNGGSESTAQGGMKSLGTLNGGSWSIAYGVSFDGSVIVGKANDGDAQDQERAFRWTAEKGMESVDKMLTDKDLLPPQLRLICVNEINPSGTVLIGEGIYDNGSTLQCAWRAVISRVNLF